MRSLSAINSAISACILSLILVKIIGVESPVYFWSLVIFPGIMVYSGLMAIAPKN